MLSRGDSWIQIHLARPRSAHCWRGVRCASQAKSRLLLTPSPPPRSSILVPIEVGGKWFGVLGFDDCARVRAWSDAERDSFRSAAGMLGAAITRQQAQEHVDNILRS